MQTTTQQVRQVLMNELGLTRESVRDIVKDLVQETVDKHIENLKRDGALQRMAEAAFENKYRDPSGKYPSSWREAIKTAASYAASEYVVSHLRWHESEAQ